MAGMINDGSIDSQEPIASINVTSLVDVMMCVLIMFMVATPLMSKQLVELPPAAGIEMTEAELDAQMVVVDGAGRVYIGELALDPEREKWSEQLKVNEHFRTAEIAFIQADETVPMVRIVDVMEALKAAGVDQVGFVTDPRLTRIKKARESEQ